MKNQGANLYCWSAGGAEYAKTCATALGIAELFTSFLPKPQVIIDDQNINDWKKLIQVHPLSCTSKKLEDYQLEISRF